MKIKDISKKLKFSKSKLFKIIICVNLIVISIFYIYSLFDKFREKSLEGIILIILINIIFLIFIKNISNKKSDFIFGILIYVMLIFGVPIYKEKTIKFNLYIGDKNKEEVCYYYNSYDIGIYKKGESGKIEIIFQMY